MSLLPLISALVFGLISIIVIIAVAEGSKKKHSRTMPSSKAKKYNKYSERDDIATEESTSLYDHEAKVEHVIKPHRRAPQETPTVKCPKCGAWYAFDNIDCSRCGYHHEGTLEELMTPIQKKRRQIKQKEQGSSSLATMGYWYCPKCGKGSYFQGMYCPYCKYQTPRQQVVSSDCIKCATHDDVKTYDTYILEVTSQNVDIDNDWKTTTTWFQQIGVETEFLCSQCRINHTFWIIAKPFLMLILILLWVLYIYLILKVDIPKESVWPIINIAIVFIGGMAALYYLPSILIGILDSIGVLISTRSRRAHTEIFIAKEVAKKYCYNILGGDLDLGTGHKVAVTPEQFVMLQKNAMSLHSQQSKKLKKISGNVKEQCE